MAKQKWLVRTGTGRLNRILERRGAERTEVALADTTIVTYYA